MNEYYSLTNMNNSVIIQLSGGIYMRVVKNPDERKQEILDAAIRVFARKGYEKTSITDIAKEINVSQGLCYRYFTSKEEMYDAAIDEYAEYIASENMKKYPLEGRNLKQQIMMMSGKVSDMAEVEKDHTDLYELFHKHGNQKLHDQLFLRVGEKYIPYVTKALEEAKQRGGTNILDPKTAAYFFIYGQMGVLMSKDIKEEDKLKKIQECIIDLLQLK